MNDKRAHGTGRWQFRLLTLLGGVAAGSVVFAIVMEGAPPPLPATLILGSGLLLAIAGYTMEHFRSTCLGMIGIAIGGYAVVIRPLIDSVLLSIGVGV